MRLIVLTLFVFLFSCDQKAVKQLEERFGQEAQKNGTPTTQTDRKSQKPDAVPLSFSRVDVSKKLDCGEANCTYIRVQYPQVITDGYDAVNRLLTDAVNVRMANYLTDDSRNADTPGLADQFLLDYQSFKTQFPESTTPWFLEIDGDVLYNTTNFSSIRIKEKAYTGGAHENTDVQYINIHRTGSRLNAYGDFFEDVEAVRKLVDENFRSLKGLEPEEDLAAKGFTFEANTFQLSDNFGFSSAGLEVYYNAYTIGSYAQGPTLVIVPWDRLVPYFKW